MVQRPTVKSHILDLLVLFFCFRPSPAILGSIISHHLIRYREQCPELVQSITDSLYVNDLIAGVDNLYEKARNIMAGGSFNLQKWNSNSSELLDKIKSLNLKTLQSTPHHQKPH